MSTCRAETLPAPAQAHAPRPPSRPAAGRADRRTGPRSGLLHALFFLASATQSMIVPLLPGLSRVHGLSATASAVMLAAPGVATVAVSLPAGALADRRGARRVTVGATALICLSGRAPHYAEGDRALVGVAGDHAAPGCLRRPGAGVGLRAERLHGPARDRGLLNCAWAVGLLLAPLIAGGVDQLAGVSAAYLATVIPTTLAALWLASRGARAPVSASSR